MAENLNTLTLGNPPVTVVGYSVAGEESVLAAPELDVVFDIGKAPRQLLSINNVCLSHGHMDHAAGLAYYFWQRDFQDNAGGRVLLPAELEEPVARMLRDWSAVEGHQAPFELVGLRPGDRFEIRRDLHVEAVGVEHGRGVASLGYVVFETRRKLRPELADLTGPEIVALKDKGEEVTFTTEVPLIAYLGDTAVFDLAASSPLLPGARILVAECTFTEPAHRSRARAGFHTHVEDLPGLLSQTRAQAVLLTHLTRRTSLRMARKALAQTVPPKDLERIHFLMERRRRDQGPGIRDQASGIRD